MNHPEQALFEEVKGLRTQMEEVRDRIFKVEQTYVSKVEGTEKRECTYKRIQDKIANYKQSLENKKILIVDGKRVPLFKSTIESNIYKSDKFLALWETSQTEILLDMDYEYFMAMMDIIKRGHNFNQLDEEDKITMNRNFKLRSKDLEKDEIFNDILKTYFTDVSSFQALVSDYNLNYRSIPVNLKELVVDVRIEPFSSNMSHLEKHDITKSKTYSDLTDPSNKKGIFLDYNSNAFVDFKSALRIKTIGLKPFTEDTNAFYPTTGSYYARLYTSSNGKDWNLVGTMPSDYGSSNNDYVCTFNLGGFKTVKHLKLNTNSSSQFSLSYIKVDYE